MLNANSEVLQSEIRDPKSEIEWLAELAELIRSSGAKVVVIDSIAWLQGPNITARHTVPLMRELKRLKSALGLSILVLAHNPRRDTSRPLTISGLHGAGVMCNFADSVFAIGQSRIDTSFRYIKHIKSRSTELACDESSVLVGEIRKWKKNFLSFRFHRFSPESDHLVRELNPLIEERAQMIKEMSEEMKMTQRQIAAKLGLSLGSVNRYLQMTREYDEYFDLDDGFYLDDDDNDENDCEAAESPSIRNPKSAIPNRNGPRGSKSAKPDSYHEDDEDGEDPMARYGLAGIDAELAKPAELDRVSSPRSSEGANEVDGGNANGSERVLLNELPEPAERVYKTLADKIEVGDIVRDNEGLLARKTFWGWSRCADALK